MAKKFDPPRDTLVPLAVSPTTRELVRQLKKITSARNVDIFLAPLLETSIREYGEIPVTQVKPTKKAKAR